MENENIIERNGEPEKNESPEIKPVARERLDKMHLPITITAAASVIAVCLILGETLFRMALWTSIAIILFWVLGNLVRYYVTTTVLPPPPPPEAEPTDEDITDEMLGENPEEVMSDSPANPPVPPRAHDYMSRE
jgi:hypothetical protein